ncbi:MAG: sialate O-acetylesterase [Roseibacillus sp.]
MNNQIKNALLVLLMGAALSAQAAEFYFYPKEGESSSKEAAHLFILSGQSNMARLDPGISFTPAIVEALGDDSVIVVKDAKGGRSISAWDRDWKSTKGQPAQESGHLYDRLLKNIKKAIAEREILTVTFLWMQGENDAARFQTGVYKKSLERLLARLKKDLGRDDLLLVLGRLSDYTLETGKHPEWPAMRDLQVAFANAKPTRIWVNTDDLNDMTDAKTGKPRNDVHYTREGYRIFGQRLADKAIELIQADTSPNVFPGEKKDFHGFDRYQFKTEGVPVTVICPKEAAPGKPWLWRSLFWDAIPLFYQADLKLVEQGYHVVLVHGDVAGHPSGNANIDAAYKLLTTVYGFSEKCSMASMSRGTLSLFRWATNNPEKVASIYVDNGVCNVLSWPAGSKVPGNSSKGNGAPKSWGGFKKKFGYATDEEALKTKESPIDLLEPLAKAGVPILMVCGNKDHAVPYEENDAIMEQRYKALGGSIKVIIENKGHSHGMKDPTPVLEFIKKHTP